MEDTIFDMPINMNINKNSQAFDLALLEKLKQLKNIPVNKFDATIRRIMRNKSSCKLWYDNKLVQEWDAGKLTMRNTNYRCPPKSRKAGNYFCLMLDRQPDGISVIDGFLSPI